MKVLGRLPLHCRPTQCHCLTVRLDMASNQGELYITEKLYSRCDIGKITFSLFVQFTIYSH